MRRYEKKTQLLTQNDAQIDIPIGALKLTFQLVHTVPECVSESHGQSNKEQRARELWLTFLHNIK